MFRRLRIYVWLLPLIWTPVAACSIRYRGDEYASFVAASFAGCWIVPILRHFVDGKTMFVFIVISGAATVAAFGVLMDKV